MANNLVENLGKELEQIDREYTTDFAGHSRLTRDVAQMDRMIKRTASIVEQVDRIPSAAQGADLGRVRDAAVESLRLYQTEREAIVKAQAVGPTFEQFSTEATSANFVFARYLRHFAGKDRSSRDVALLGEMVEDLRQIEKRMTAVLEESKKPGEFERDRQVVRDSLAQYQKEIDLIEEAQKSGTPEDQASVLATLANSQFAVYQGHFAGEARVSRRPALLMRVIGTLKKVRDRMVALRTGGLQIEFNDKNIGIVEDRLKTYENELAEIRKVRQATPMTEIMGELGTAANKLFDEYRGNFADKPRNLADAARLANICDKLGEVRRQMVDMSFAEDSEMNHKNLDIVTEQLVMFEGEYEAVSRSQTSK
ncbi:MAG: hypothetical protein NVS3B10_19940 [Polyangiales bacterium]